MKVPVRSMFCLEMGVFVSEGQKQRDIRENGSSNTEKLLH